MTEGRAARTGLGRLHLRASASAPRSTTERWSSRIFARSPAIFRMVGPASSSARATASGESARAIAAISSGLRAMKLRLSAMVTPVTPRAAAACSSRRPASVAAPKVSRASRNRSRRSSGPTRRSPASRTAWLNASMAGPWTREARRASGGIASAPNLARASSTSVFSRTAMSCGRGFGGSASSADFRAAFQAAFATGGGGGGGGSALPRRGRSIERRKIASSRRATKSARPTGASRSTVWPPGSSQVTWSRWSAGGLGLAASASRADASFWRAISAMRSASSRKIPLKWPATRRSKSRMSLLAETARDPSRALFTAARRFARSVRSASVRRAFRWAAVRIRGAPGWALIVSA